MKRSLIVLAALASMLAAAPAWASAEFDLFNEKFTELNATVLVTVGKPLFTEAEEGTPGVLAVHATDLWMRGTARERVGSIDTVHKMWKAAHGGAQVTVIILGPEGHTVIALWDTPDGGYRMTAVDRVLE